MKYFRNVTTFCPTKRNKGKLISPPEVHPKTVGISKVHVTIINNKKDVSTTVRTHKTVLCFSFNKQGKFELKYQNDYYILNKEKIAWNKTF